MKPGSGGGIGHDSGLEKMMKESCECNGNCKWEIDVKGEEMVFMNEIEA